MKADIAKTLKAFGTRLRVLRERAEQTGADLAAVSGVSRQTIHNLETGKSRPSWATLTKLAAALSLTVDELVGRAKSAK